jgi:hypothetical protein
VARSVKRSRLTGRFVPDMDRRAEKLAQELAEGTVGRFFRTDRRNQAVQVERVIMAPLGSSGIWYEVSDLSLGYLFNISEERLREELTEMEVIAWAARGSE